MLKTYLEFREPSDVQTQKIYDDFIKQANTELRALPREDVSTSAEDIITRLINDAIRRQHKERMAAAAAAFDKSSRAEQTPPPPPEGLLARVNASLRSYFARVNKGGSSYKYKSRNMRKSRKMRKMRKSRKSCRKGRK